MTRRRVARAFPRRASPAVSPDGQHRGRDLMSTAVCRDRPKPVDRRGHRQCGHPACDRPVPCRRCGASPACDRIDRGSAPPRVCGDSVAGSRVALLTWGPPGRRPPRRRAVAKRRPRWRTTGVRVDDGVKPLCARTPLWPSVDGDRRESAAGQQAEIAAAHHRLGILDQTDCLGADGRRFPLGCGLLVRFEEYRGDLAIRGAGGSAV